LGRGISQSAEDEAIFAKRTGPIAVIPARLQSHLRWQERDEASGRRLDRQLATGAERDDSYAWRLVLGARSSWPPSTTAVSSCTTGYYAA